MQTLRKSLSKLALIVFLALIAIGAHAQSPFSETTVEVKKISESTLAVAANADENSNNGQQSDDKGNIFQRIGRFVKSGFNKVVNAIKNRNQPGKLPPYISRAVTIPGHETAEFVMQGICPMPELIETNGKKAAFYRYILLSYYPKTDKTSQPAQLILIDSLTGKATRRFALYLADDKPYTGHAGGITAAGNYLWVASGYNLYGFELKQIIAFAADRRAKAPAQNPYGLPPSFRLPARDLLVKKIFPVDSTASYASFDGKYLWVGDFVKSSDSKYGPVPHHAENRFNLKTWIAGYRVDQSGMPIASQKYKFSSDGKSREAYKPDRLIFCRESVQGFAISEGFTALSISYGARASKLALYKAPASKNSFKHSFKPEGQSKTFSAEAWVVDSATHLTTLELPAGSEDLEYDGHVLYVGFEGASPNYRQKWTKINPLLKIEDRFYLINPKLIPELKP